MIEIKRLPRREFAKIRLLSPISYASYIGKEKAVELLISLRANVNGLYSGAPNPIQLSTHYHSENITKLLQDAGASPDDAKPIGNETFLKAFHEMYELINNYLIEARKDNKKLLIVLGETHRLLEPFVCEYICMLICRELGIKDMFIEIDDARLASLKKEQWETHWLTLIREAESKSMDIIPIDSLNHNGYFPPQSAKGMNYRDIEMCSHLNKHYSEGVVIVGAAHLKGIITKNRLSSRHYNILPVFIHSSDNTWNVDDDGVRYSELENAKCQVPGAKHIFISGSYFGLTIREFIAKIDQAATQYRKMRHDFDLGLTMYRSYIAKKINEHNADEDYSQTKITCKIIS